MKTFALIFLLVNWLECKFLFNYGLLIKSSLYLPAESITANFPPAKLCTSFSSSKFTAVFEEWTLEFDSLAHRIISRERFRSRFPFAIVFPSLIMFNFVPFQKENVVRAVTSSATAFDCKSLLETLLFMSDRANPFAIVRHCATEGQTGTKANFHEDIRPFTAVLEQLKWLSCRGRISAAEEICWLRPRGSLKTKFVLIQLMKQLCNRRIESERNNGPALT